RARKRARHRARVRARARVARPGRRHRGGRARPRAGRVRTLGPARAARAGMVRRAHGGEGRRVTRFALLARHESRVPGWLYLAAGVIFAVGAGLAVGAPGEPAARVFAIIVAAAVLGWLVQRPEAALGVILTQTIIFPA